MKRERMKHPARDRSPDPARRDWVLVGLAGVGVIVAGYLAVTKLAGGEALFCTAGSGCDVVQASRYAMLLGVPTALWGAALYAAVGGLAVAGLPPQRWLMAFLLSVSAVSFSAYLTYLELFVIEAVCGYCVGSAVVAAALFGVLLWRRPAPGGRRSPTRPRRVIALGVLTGVATVVVGVGVFALGTPREAAAYQEALARHLSASGAVMYGAFW